MHSVKFTNLVEPKNILMPQMHVKLRLIKQFVTALNPTTDSFQILQKIFQTFWYESEGWSFRWAGYKKTDSK